jgi:hypothetical protein
MRQPRTFYRVKHRRDQLAVSIPEISHTNGEPIAKELLINTDIQCLILLRFKIRIPEIGEKGFIDGGNPKTGRITGPQLGPGFLDRIPSGHLIRGGISEGIMRLVPQARRGEESIPHVELHIGEAGMAGKGFPVELPDVDTLGFPELIARRHQPGLPR